MIDVVKAEAALQAVVDACRRGLGLDPAEVNRLIAVAREALAPLPCESCGVTGGGVEDRGNKILYCENCYVDSLEDAAVAEYRETISFLGPEDGRDGEAASALQSVYGPDD